VTASALFLVAALLLVAALALLFALVLALMCLDVLLVGADDLGPESSLSSSCRGSRCRPTGSRLPTLLVVVPVAFLATLPAWALPGRLVAGWLVVSPVVAVVAVVAVVVVAVAASRGWRRVLRHTTGASA